VSSCIRVWHISFDVSSCIRIWHISFDVSSCIRVWYITFVCFLFLSEILHWLSSFFWDWHVSLPVKTIFLFLHWHSTLFVSYSFIVLHITLVVSSCFWDLQYLIVISCLVFFIFLCRNFKRCYLDREFGIKRNWLILIITFEGNSSYHRYIYTVINVLVYIN
jgi:hypothetical protein